MPSVPVKRSRATSAGRAAPRARAVDDDADGADQYAARDPARARDSCCRPAPRAALQAVPTILEDAATAAARRTCATCSPACTRKSARSRSASPRSSASCAPSPRPIPVVTRLRTIPGIGLLTATALVGSVGHIHAFRRARQFASWLGLTPREHSSGPRRRLGGISKRGDVLPPLPAHARRPRRPARGPARAARGATADAPASVGPDRPRRGAATTKPRLPWRTNSAASSGRSGTKDVPFADAGRRVTRPDSFPPEMLSE